MPNPPTPVPARVIAAATVVRRWRARHGGAAGARARRREAGVAPDAARGDSYTETSRTTT